MVSRILPLFALISLALLGRCAMPFPETDISTVVRDRSAQFFTTAASSYSVHGGYGSACEHPGAHANFSAGTYPIYAVLDGVVSSIDPCRTAGENDKFDIQLLVGMKGSVPVYFEYSLEPFAGSVCGNVGFSSSILVEEGQQVKKGDLIASFTAVGSGAHVHFNLKADGATICPEIFPASIFASQTGSLSGCASAAANTFCHSLTSSEDPGRLQ